MSQTEGKKIEQQHLQIIQTEVEMSWGDLYKHEAIDQLMQNSLINNIWTCVGI